MYLTARVLLCTIWYLWDRMWLCLWSRDGRRVSRGRRWDLRLIWGHRGRQEKWWYHTNKWEAVERPTWSWWEIMTIIFIYNCCYRVCAELSRIYFSLFDRSAPIAATNPHPVHVQVSVSLARIYCENSQAPLKPLCTHFSMEIRKYKGFYKRSRVPIFNPHYTQELT